MSFSNWFFNIAIGGWLILAPTIVQAQSTGPETPTQLIQSDQAKESDNNSAKSDQSRPIIHNHITVIVPEKDKVSAEPYEPNCKKPKDHDEADLCEQRRMAKAAEQSVDLAEWQVWIGGIGAILVFFSLIFAGIGAFAASRQVKLSRETLVSTDRAFVFPQNVVWSAFIDLKTGKIAQWVAVSQWKNSGNTPTRNLRFFTSRYVEKEDLPETFDLDASTGELPPLLIAPANTLEGAQQSVSIEECEGIIAGNLHFYLFGWAEYDDVFAKTQRHRTEFCYKISVGGNPRLADKCAIRWNIHTRHNGADEDCDAPLQTTSMKEAGK